VEGKTAGMVGVCECCKRVKEQFFFFFVEKLKQIFKHDSKHHLKTTLEANTLMIIFGCQFLGRIAKAFQILIAKLAQARNQTASRKSIQERFYRTRLKHH
jgi:hypothetical protein